MSRDNGRTPEPGLPGLPGTAPSDPFRGRWRPAADVQLPPDAQQRVQDMITSSQAARLRALADSHNAPLG